MLAIYNEYLDEDNSSKSSGLSWSLSKTKKKGIPLIKKEYSKLLNKSTLKYLKKKYGKYWFKVKKKRNGDFHSEDVERKLKEANDW